MFRTCTACRRRKWLDAETFMCIECLESILVDQHGRSHPPGSDDRCPCCRAGIPERISFDEAAARASRMALTLD